MTRHMDEFGEQLGAPEPEPRCPACYEPAELCLCGREIEGCPEHPWELDLEYRRCLEIALAIMLG